MKKLHPLQIKLLETLRSVDNQENYSLEDLRKAIDASSRSQVVHHLQQLERKGLLKRDPDFPQRFIVYGENEAEDSFAFMPIVALASCGGGLINDTNVIDYVPVKNTLLPTKIKNSFLVKADGDSMLPQIKHGDILFVEHYRPGTPLPLNKVVVCRDEEGVKIKKLVESNGNFILVSNNNEYSPKVVSTLDLEVYGLVRGALYTAL